MKKFAAILLLLASLHARADFIIVENLTIAGQSQDLTMKFKGDKARMDMGSGQMSMIVDASTGDTITLIHGQKMFMKVSGDKLKAILEQSKKMMGQDAPDSAVAPKPVDTGKSEKVGDYNTEIYTVEMKGKKFTFWMSKDFPNFAALQAQINKLQSLQEKLGQGKGPDTSKIDGVPVKTETVMNGKTITTLLVSEKETPVDDADLQVPAGYTEMQMPQMPPGGGAAGGDGGAPPPQAPPQQP